MKQFYLLVSLLVSAGALTAQVTGGQTTFQFMTLPASACLTGLGGLQIAVLYDDLGFASANPAALNPTMDGQLQFNHNFFLSDIQHGYAAYVHHLPQIGFTVQGALQYMNYGDIKMADEFGQIQGDIKAGETAFTLGAARMLSDRFSLGLNLRFGVSTLDVYQASALSAEAGVIYNDTSSLFSAAVVIRNAGAQLATYNGVKEDLPFDIQIGLTKRLRHLPFRFGVVYHHVQDWDIRYDDPALQNTDDVFFGEQPEESGNPGIDNFFRHFVFNGEFLLGKAEVFRVRVGYNNLRKKELSVPDYRSLAGFSGGIGIKTRRLRIDFGYGSYHLAGGVVHFGLGTNLKEFF